MTTVLEKPRESKQSAQSDVVIVANRLPVHRVRGDDGQNTWKTSPGGLVSALSPILQSQPSTWIGWAGNTDEKYAPFELDGIVNHPVALNHQELVSFYDGFSNGTIWPLYHDAVRPPKYHRKWWRSYVAINRRFADAAAEVVAPNGIVWVHDYQLQLVPQMIRESRPDVRIGYFLHIPFPPRELFMQLPWRRSVIQGMLGADVVGFQTVQGAHNFIHLSRQLAGLKGNRDNLHIGDRRITIDAFPISIDFKKFDSLARSTSVIERAKRYRQRLGDQRTIVLGIDRLDYTKGIDTRLRSYLELLRSGRISPKQCVLVQICVPTRERVDEYKELRSNVERLVGEIEGDFGEMGRRAVHYMHKSVPASELTSLYCAADVMLVTPVRDGMNLVVKEYIASKVNNTGSVVLSEFAGAARELSNTLLVNPHDVDGLIDTIERAINMPGDEQARRMRALRRQVRSHDVFRWANDFFSALDHDRD